MLNRVGLVLVASILLLARPLGATPSQQDVFKSIQESVDQKTEVNTGPALMLAGGGVVVLLILAGLSRRDRRAAVPAPLNHRARLLREVLRELPLGKSELKQLKILAEAAGAQAGEETSPLTLLLCPSLISRGLETNPPKLDRRELANLVRKMGRR